mmetsp:Transcript_32905/g.57523  ORF Transcript_32905/g.57523 Transcript_32905/m.57523 type:complete len:459 (-) Transcript_32905:1707-3083(-)
MGDQAESLSVSMVKSETSKSKQGNFSPGRLHLPAKALLSLIIVSKLLIYVDLSVMSTLMPLLDRQGFHVNEVQAGWFDSVVCFGFVSSTLSVAYLSSHFHPFNLITAGLLAWTASALLASVSQAYWMLLLARVLSGLCEGVYLPLISPIVLEMAPGKSKSLWYSLYLCTMPIGSSLGYAFGSNVGFAYGWRTPFWIEALLMFPLAMCFALLYRDPRFNPITPRSSSSFQSICGVVKILYRNRVFLCMTFAVTSFLFVVSGLGYWLPYTLEHLFNTSSVTAGNTASLNSMVTGTLGSLLGSIYQDRCLANHQTKFEQFALSEIEMDRARCRTSLKVCRFSAGLAFLFLLACLLSNEFFIFVGLYGAANFMIGFFNGAVWISLMTCVAKHLRSQALSFALVVSVLLGSLPSSVTVGTLIPLLGIRTAFSILVLSLLPCSLLSIVANLSTRVKPGGFRPLP